MADYIPRPDAQFDSWQDAFATYVAAHIVDLGLTPADADVLLLASG